MALLTAAMSGVPGVTGVLEVIKNIRESQERIAKASERGVKKAALALQRESMRLCPVDTGVLKASCFTRAEGEGLETEVTVGYTARYALYVHENVQMKLRGRPRPPPHHGSYWDPQGQAQAKFLEEPMRRMGPELLAIIREEIKKA